MTRKANRKVLKNGWYVSRTFVKSVAFKVEFHVRKSDNASHPNRLMVESSTLERQTTDHWLASQQPPETCKQLVPKPKLVRKGNTLKNQPFNSQNGPTKLMLRPKNGLTRQRRGAIPSLVLDRPVRCTPLKSPPPLRYAHLLSSRKLP